MRFSSNLKSGIQASFDRFINFHIFFGYFRWADRRTLTQSSLRFSPTHVDDENSRLIVVRDVRFMAVIGIFLVSLTSRMSFTLFMKFQALRRCMQRMAGLVY